VARCPRRAAGGVGHEALDDAILKAVERHHDQPPARIQQGGGLREAAIELAQLVIDGDAQRLKTAGGAVDSGWIARRRPANDGGQPNRAFDRRQAAFGADGARDPARPSFLSVSMQDLRQLGLGGGVDDFRRRGTGVAHAHVERTIGAEGETARRLVQLVGRHAEVEDDAVQGADPFGPQQVEHVAKAAM